MLKEIYNLTHMAFFQITCITIFIKGNFDHTYEENIEMRLCDWVITLYSTSLYSQCLHLTNFVSMRIS